MRQRNEWKSELEDKMVEMTVMEQNKEKRMQRNENRIRDLWDNTKHINIWIIGIPKEEKKEKGYEKIFEKTIVENFPNVGKEIITQVQEAKRVPYKINPRRNMLRHILIKQTNKNETQIRTIESVKGKETNNIQGNSHKVISWFFSRNSTGQKGLAGYI